MTETLPHILVVTQECDPHPGEPHGTECLEGVIECPGLTGSCVEWEPCSNVECAAYPREDDDQPIIHGVVHFWLGSDYDGWGTESTRCYYATGDLTCDAVRDLLPLPPGRYPITVQNIDDCPVFELVGESVGA